MNITRKTGIVAVSAAAVILGVGGFGIAQTAIPDSGGVVHGCYKTSVPAHGTPLSVIDSEAGGSCPTGYSALTWNQAGPAGPTGATGATGPAGAAGPSTAGPSGLDVEIVTAIEGTSTYLPAVATCPSDHPYLLGGAGYDFTAAGPVGGYPDNVPTSTAEETGTQTWTVPSPGADSHVAYAFCVK